MVLIEHGGGQHKQGWEVISRAFRYVTACGFAVAAIDAPGTGGRPEHPEIRRLVALIDARKAAGEPLGAAQPALYETVAAQLIPDWRTTLDALQHLDCVGDSGPVGYYGLSAAGESGIRLVAAEHRITAAVLGLMACDWLIDTAARITVSRPIHPQSTPRHPGTPLCPTYQHRHTEGEGGLPAYQA
ncbi:hypothetical protein [Dactylosporangium matsuzakiense]|uniref:hypothetical protein n=1 Tax=Dactylosporangium matsuzakiense TaxID=53360 RepID=UPI0021C3AF03|nr:hypothetical protein [Dactylosporangium matsuzakiense]UWZ47834.1 hypothetical protein Dmats_16370 [Dactylosporangium matsuzakiense]